MLVTFGARELLVLKGSRLGSLLGNETGECDMLSMNCDSKKVARSAGLIGVLLTVLLMNSLANATTYYVGRSGNNANSCIKAQNRATPKLSIRAALNCVGIGANVGAGHTVIVQAGTYDEELMGIIPGGTSWASPFTLKAEERGRVTIQPKSGACSGQPCSVIQLDNYESFVEIDGFILDASNTMYYGFRSYNDYVRLLYTEIYNSYYSCILSSGSYGEFLHLKLHGCGKRNPEYHADQGGPNDIYLSGNYNVVAYVHLYDGSAGIAFWHDVAVPSYNVAHHNIVESGGIGLYRGPGNKAYNNLLVNTGIWVGWDCRDCMVLNNTIYKNTTLEGYGILINPKATGTVVANNILWENQVGPILDQGVNSKISHNLSANPRFVNAAGGNFQLQVGSPAIDTGLALAAEGVKDDLIGTPRPKDNGYDIGAYEYTLSSDSSPPSPPQNVRVQ